MRKAVVAFVLCMPLASLGAEGLGWSVPFFPVNDIADDDVTALGDDMVFASGNDGALIAIGIDSGQRAWRFQVGTAAMASNIVIAGGPGALQEIDDAVARGIVLQTPAWHSPLVYVGSRHAQPETLPNFYAIDGQSGAPRWSFFAQGGVYGSAEIDGDRVLVVGRREVYSLDAATGQAHWSFEPLAGLHEMARRPPTVPVFDGDSVYVTVWPFHQHDAPEHSYLFALDAASGEKRWTVDVPGDDVTAALIHGDLVYFAVMAPTDWSREDDTIVASGGDSSLVYAVNRSDGSIRWTAVIENTFMLWELVLGDGLLYVGATRNDGDDFAVRVVALDAESGAERWSLDDWLLEPAIPASIGTYIAGESGVAALDPETGRPQREIRLKDGIVRAVADGQWLYASTRNRLSAYDLATGTVLWQRRLDSDVKTVMPGSGFVVVVTRGVNVFGQTPQPGAIYRLDAATGEGVSQP